MILLDTHAAIWLATDNSALGKSSRTMALAARDRNSLAISAVSFWEIALRFERGRLKLHSTSPALRTDLLRTGVVEIPLTGLIAIQSVELGRLHYNPANRFIAATAIEHNAILMTADRRLLDWRHKLKRHDASR